MLRQRTHRTSAGRFERTASGGLKRHHAYARHRFHGKTKRQHRHLRKIAMVSTGDLKCIKQILSQMR